MEYIYEAISDGSDPNTASTRIAEYDESIECEVTESEGHLNIDLTSGSIITVDGAMASLGYRRV